MSITMLSIVLVGASVLGSTMAIPQVVKLARTRCSAGISPTWVALSVMINAAWAAYGFGVGDLGIVPVSVVSVLVYLAIGVMVLRSGIGGAARSLVAGVLVAGLVAAALVLGGWTAVGLVLGAMYAVQLSPAVVAAYRSRDVAGVSTATWWMAFAEAVLWGVYGWARADVGLLALSAGGTLMAGLVLLRLMWQRAGRLPLLVRPPRPAFA